MASVAVQVSLGRCSWEVLNKKSDMWYFGTGSGLGRVVFIDGYIE
jgi:hypothetical protein